MALRRARQPAITGMVSLAVVGVSPRVEALRCSRANATQFVGCETDGVRYVTRIERFVQGDYPMVCGRSGLPATKMVPVQARRSTVWPWFLLPLSIFWFVVAKWAADSDHCVAGAGFEPATFGL